MRRVARLEELVLEAIRNKEIAKHGLQGVHAEVMRRLASEGRTAFVDYADIRAIYDNLVARPVAAECWLLERS
jgi:hypothetical protein